MTHWKKLKNPDYLGSWDIDGLPHLTATIKKITKREVFSPSKNANEECIVCEFEGGIKPMILNSTNCKMLREITGSPYIEQWAGRRVTIKSVRIKAFGKMEDALRIQRQTIETESIQCASCGGIVSGTQSKTAQDVAEATNKRYGVIMCAKCARQKEEEKNGTNE